MNKPLMKPSLLVSPVSNGYVVYDIEGNQFHELNPTSALLLELCDGQRCVEEILELAGQVLPENSAAAVREWFADAEEAGLLVESGGAESPSALKMSADDLVKLASELRDEGLVQAAYLCQERAVSISPNDIGQLRELGELAHIIGKRDKARETYERYLELVPDDAEVRHLLVSLRDEQAPDRVPDECIQQLYQRFASFYESNMCGELDYEGPTHLSSVIEDALGDRCDLNVLDLGCGTGLAGLAIKHRAKRLVGVDLSPEMIEQARSCNIYDELHTAEVTQWLTDLTENFDLIIACDTFIYFGDLTRIIGLAAGRLSEGGTMAFSVERAESGSHQLTDNGRYVHHRSHLDDASREAGLSIRHQKEAFIRMEYGKPVEGLYVSLSRTTTADSPETRILETAEV